MSLDRVHREVVRTWCDFSPSSWCDHRPIKTTEMCPDFIEPPARD